MTNEELIREFRWSVMIWQKACNGCTLIAEQRAQRDMEDFSKQILERMNDNDTL